MFRRMMVAIAVTATLAGPAVAAGSHHQSRPEVPQGEAKNQLPFTRTVAPPSAVTRDTRNIVAQAERLGDVKNERPFTRPAAPVRAAVVDVRGGFQWADAGIGAAAAAGVMLLVAGTTLLTGVRLTVHQRTGVA